MEKQILGQIYFGESINALRGPVHLHRQARLEGHDISLAKCKTFLRGLDAYTLYRPARRTFPRRPFITNFVGHVFQLDVMDMQRFADYNQGVRYALLGIDTYSRFTACELLKNRKTGTLLRAIESMLASLPFRVHAVLMDKESAFISGTVQSFFKKRKIIAYNATGDVKCAAVERLIRTCRLAIQRNFVATGSWSWTEFLPKFLNRYNKRVHSTTKLRPADVVTNPLIYVKRANVAPAQKPSLKPPPVGSYARLTRARGPHEKEASGTYTKEIFRIKRLKRAPGMPDVVYLEDLTGKPIQGGVYPEEVQRVEWNGEKRPKDVFKTRTYYY